MKKRILIFYRELAGYMLACVHELCEQYDIEVEIVAYPINSDAPFLFDSSPNIKVHKRTECSDDDLNALVQNGSFNLIFCGGWGDKGYLKSLKHRKCKTVLAFDNQWTGNWKQQLARLYGHITLKHTFDFAFVPGSFQKEFAKKLGFHDAQIILGVYSCDVAKFAQLCAPRNARATSNSKKLIYTGRYANEKFVTQLFRAFHQLHTAQYSNWQLHCIGTGPLWDTRPKLEGITHHGFKQPAELFEIMKQGDAFVLPSTFEPWGVVAHEFAAAGYPMLLSSNVGAAEKFLEENKNGFTFRSGDEDDLKEKMKTLFSLDDQRLKKMGEYSSLLSTRITPITWAKSLFDIM